MANRARYTIEPWDRQVKETARAFAAFLAYRDLGLDRTLTKAAEKIGLSVGTVHGLSTRHKWAPRAAEWDREQDRMFQMGLRKEQHAAGRRHAGIAAAHLAALQQPTQELIRRITARTFDWAKVNDAQLLRLVQMAAIPARAMAELERLSLGMHTEHTAVTDADGKPLQATSIAAAVLQMFTVPDPVEGEVVDLAPAPVPAENGAAAVIVVNRGEPNGGG